MPDYLIDEVNEHMDRIAKLARKNKGVIAKAFENLLKNVKVINVDQIPKNLVRKSEMVMKDIDVDDSFFVALHFHTRHKIWTGDKILIEGLKAKGYDICITTEELKEKLYKM